jgi:UDP-glucose 4-epimerase
MDEILLGDALLPEMRDLVEDTLASASSDSAHPHSRAPSRDCLYYVHSMIGEYLRQQRVPTVMGFDPMMQFIHEEDVSEAIALTLQHGLQGVFNVVGPGAVPVSVAIREAGSTAWPMPEQLMRPLIDRLFRWGIVPYPAGAMDYIKYR